MKTLLFILLFLSSSLHAGITRLFVERVDARGDVAAYFKVTAYGLLSNGVPKTFDLTSTGDKLKANNVENCPWDGSGFNRQALRYWIYFDEDGAIKTIDFHMGEKWEQKVYPNEEFPELTSQMVTEINALKALIESK